MQEPMTECALYLIKPEKWKADVVYKTVHRDGLLYFCRAGGQFYNIDPKIAANDNLSEEELLSHKKSFLILISDITQVEIDTKPRMHTGSVPANGSVYITTAEQKHDFIIHPVNDYTMAEEFFKAITGAPVTVEIDEKTKAAKLEEEAAAEYAARSPERFERLAKVCKAMNVISWVYGIWAVFLSVPELPVVLVGLLLPIIAFSIHLANRDIVMLMPYAKVLSINQAICIPAVSLVLFTLFQYNIFHTMRLWVIVIAATAVLSALALKLSEERKKRKILYLLIPLFVLVFVYGAVISTNIEFDAHPHPDPANHQFAQIDRMRISTGEGPDRNIFTLSVIDHPENMQVRLTPDNFEVTVSRRSFDRAEEGDLVRLCVLPGLWGIPWVSCVTIL